MSTEGLISHGNLMLMPFAPLIRLGAGCSFVLWRYLRCLRQAWGLLPVLIFVCVLWVLLITAFGWSRAQKSPWMSGLETMVIFLQQRRPWKLAPYVPTTLSQHNRMLRCQEGVLLSLSHLCSCSHQLSTTTLPHQELLCLKIDSGKNRSCYF